MSMTGRLHAAKISSLPSALIALAALSLAPLAADDRGLLRSNASDPYVFIVLDTSGSMNWSPKCTQAQFDSGVCDFLCPTGDCFTPMSGDDPASKFRQAKEALFEVLNDVGGVNFGFATYNQDGLNVKSKHWLYQATSAGPTIPGIGPWPAIGVQEVFGTAWTCTNGSTIGCGSTTAANLGVAWEADRVRRLPKGGQPFSLVATTTAYVKNGASVYKVAYKGILGAYGSPITVQVAISLCTNGSCSTSTPVAGSPKNVTWSVVSDFLSWDNGATTTNPQLGYFPQGTASDHNVSNTCAGWDPNTDSGSDPNGSSVNLRFSTTTDPLGAAMNVGDVIPLDWRSDHVLEIQRRLAPNLRTNPAAVPDTRVATYFNDNFVLLETFLRPKNLTQNVKPLIPDGSTPLGNSVANFSDWYDGFKAIAATRDPLWSCRQKFLVILTDGDDTCGGNDPCAVGAGTKGTSHLFVDEKIKTYVVAFGVENIPPNKLTCMAVNGGTGAALFPQNEDELVAALTDIFSQVREQSTTFASAAVPSVQAEVADRIFLTSFTPIDKKSTWDGHLDAYLKPLPTVPKVLPTDPEVPDRNRLCPAVGSPNRSACRLWDAGEVLKSQAPTLASIIGAPTIDPTTLRLGLADDQRRVLYGKADAGTGVPRSLRLFTPPTGDPASDPLWLDLWAGFGIPTPADAAERTEAVNQSKTIIKTNLGVKSVPKLDVNGTPIPGQTIEYLLGDIFHADPLVIDRPNDFLRFATNLGGASNPDTKCLTPDRGYLCWALKHQTRRKLILAASNDGQLHAFDAGIWDNAPSAQKFNDGSGKELFSFMPRLSLPLVREFGLRTRQILGIDGTPSTNDVFIDPINNGSPSAAAREWRTVVIGGYREGGRVNTGGEKFLEDFVSGYYALDVTQPDTFSGGAPSTAIVPTCLALDNSPVPGCSTNPTRQMPFPALLWEFTDSIQGSRSDEDDTNNDGTPDGNASPDLGQTWSSPTIARIQVVDAGTVEDRYVAIFGGGFDGENKPSPQSGNFLYMVDVETGKTIYKRQVLGAVTGDPAVVDTDLNGLADRVYFGTTAGFVYKMDIRSPGVMGNVILNKDRFLPPLLADQTVKRITDSGWKPFPIFDALGKPVYMPSAPIFVQALNKFAVGFGTGDREDLWNFGQPEGRYYLILDDNFLASEVGIGGVRGLPKDESKFHPIPIGSGPNAATADFIASPTTPEQAGWFLKLALDERLITQTFALSGVLIFSSFQPTIDFLPGPPVTCKRGGESHIFVVNFSNANPLVSGRSRFTVVPKFVTNPYVEINATKNPPPDSTAHHSESVDKVDKAFLNAMKRTMPRDCKFGNFWFSVSGIRSDTGYERYASIPICFSEKNFKEY